VLGGIFGTKGEEVIEEWRKFHNEELHTLYSTIYNDSNEMKEVKISGAYTTHGRDQNCIEHKHRKTWKKETNGMEY
jgi:hypothetical protein